MMRQSPKPYIPSARWSKPHLIPDSSSMYPDVPEVYPGWTKLPKSR
jgi:hypothetical protein